MPRGILNLQDPADLQAVNGVWRWAPGLVPGEPNEGLVSQSEGSPSRLPDYDDSGWEICDDLTEWHSRGVTFAWYRIKVTLPDQVEGRDIAGARCIFETCIDDYGELWIDGECNRDRGSRPGVQRPPARGCGHRTEGRRRSHHCPAGYEWPHRRARRGCLCALRHPRLRVAHPGVLVNYPKSPFTLGGRRSG